MTFTGTIDAIIRLIEGAGVLVIVGGIAFASTRYALVIAGRTTSPNPYREYRRRIGRSILLGLELLVAGDIIRTVAITPTLQSVVVLGGIVLIRTFLSLSLEVEIEHRWPWQSDPPAREGR